MYRKLCCVSELPIRGACIVNWRIITGKTLKPKPKSYFVISRVCLAGDILWGTIVPKLGGFVLG